MDLLLQRDLLTDKRTFGSLYIDGVFECYTLEDTVREIPNKRVEEWKVPGETAIPIGKYGVIIDWSNRFKRLMPHILGIPGFTGVRIHSGNTEKDTEGCILVGRQKTSDSIIESRLAFDPLFDKLHAAKQIKIEIKGPLLVRQ